MPSLEQQLTALANQLSSLHDAIPVEADTVGVTLEPHRPGNGSTYTRLRVQKGKALANGKRTMSVNAEDAEKWAQKIYARNQQAKVAQCLTLVQQAADIAGAISWDSSEGDCLVNESKNFTIEQTEYIAPGAAARPKVTIQYVLKDAKSATTMNRKVHAISEAEPDSGRWYAPALCGEQPKADSWGWRRVDSSELSCPKCHDKLKLLT